ncbi:MAG: hypothetical protein ACFFA0_01915 [Promethearchaeota archaeon]
MSELIEQKEDKKYYLKELGNYAYHSLKDNIETISTPKRGFKSPILKKLMVLSLKRFIVFNKKDRIYAILISAVIIILGTIFTYLNELSSFLLFFIEIEQDNITLLYQILVNFSFIINFFAFFIIVESISRIFYKKNENALNFLLSFALILFPMIIYLILHLIFEYTVLITMNILNFIDKILMIIFQAWSLWLLSYSLSVKKGLKIENSLILSLMLNYTLIIFLTFI